MFNRINIILFLIIIFFISISFLPQTVSIDNYEFKVSPRFKIIKEANKENVLLSLYNKEGAAVIIQNKLNILATTLLKSYTGDDLLMRMHTFKYDGYIKELKGYDISSSVMQKQSNSRVRL